MARYRTLSKTFQAGHSLAGEKTFFVEKFLNSMGCEYWKLEYLDKLYELNQYLIDVDKVTYGDVTEFFSSLGKQIPERKHHTVRGGSHFKTGDMLSVRCWIGRPYFSSPIKIWDDVELKSVQQFEVKEEEGHVYAKVDGVEIYNDVEDDKRKIARLAINDGLTLSEFKEWFKWGKPFSGQILCWSDNIKY